MYDLVENVKVNGDDFPPFEGFISDDCVALAEHDQFHLIKFSDTVSAQSILL